MPAENVERAIKKGTGELPGVTYDEITYEGYGPGGVAFVVQVTTDNKNRAASAVRSMFAKNGGNLAGSGAVMFQFLHCGQFLVAREAATEDRLMELALEAGAEDVIASEDGYELRFEIGAFDRVSQAFEPRRHKNRVGRDRLCANHAGPDRRKDRRAFGGVARCAGPGRIGRRAARVQ